MSEQLRLSRRNAHKWFDRLWKYSPSPETTRTFWYKKLAEHFKVKEIHISEMDENQCQQVLVFVKPLLRKGKRREPNHSNSAK